MIALGIPLYGYTSRQVWQGAVTEFTPLLLALKQTAQSTLSRQTRQTWLPSCRLP